MTDEKRELYPSEIGISDSEKLKALENVVKSIFSCCGGVHSTIEYHSYSNDKTVDEIDVTDVTWDEDLILALRRLCDKYQVEIKSEGTKEIYEEYEYISGKLTLELYKKE